MDRDFDEVLNAAIVRFRGAGVQAMSPAAQVGLAGQGHWGLGLGHRLPGLGAGVGRRSNATSPTGRSHARCKLRQRRQETLVGLARDPAGSLDAVADAFVAEGAWLDVAGRAPVATRGGVGPRRPPHDRGQDRRRSDECRAAVLRCTSHFSEVVAEVAELPKIPSGVWSVSKNPAEELAKHRVHR